MVYLILGLVLFLGVHSVEMVSPGLRATAVARMGERSWKGLYALIALIGFVVFILLKFV